MNQKQIIPIFVGHHPASIAVPWHSFLFHNQFSENDLIDHSILWNSTHPRFVVYHQKNQFPFLQTINQFVLQDPLQFALQQNLPKLHKKINQSEYFNFQPQPKNFCTLQIENKFLFTYEGKLGGATQSYFQPIRKQMQICDWLDGSIILNDSNNGYSYFAKQLIQYYQQEANKKTILSFSIHDQQQNQFSRINQIMNFKQFYQSVDIFIPFNISHLTYSFANDMPIYQGMAPILTNFILAITKKGSERVYQFVNSICPQHQRKLFNIGYSVPNRQIQNQGVSQIFDYKMNNQLIDFFLKQTHLNNQIETYSEYYSIYGPVILPKEISGQNFCLKQVEQIHQQPSFMNFQWKKQFEHFLDQFPFSIVCFSNSSWHKRIKEYIDLLKSQKKKIEFTMNNFGVEAQIEELIQQLNYWQDFYLNQ